MSKFIMSISLVRQTEITKIAEKQENADWSVKILATFRNIREVHFAVDVIGQNCVTAAKSLTRNDFCILQVLELM